MAFDWSEFYTAQGGRGVRPTFTAGLNAWRGDAPGDAIDLGCGDGVETRHLAERGWSVLAIDSDGDVESRVLAEVGEEGAERATVRRATFETVGALPASDFIYAGFALPFCDPGHFPYLWADIRDALRPGAVFAGELFGPNDEWFGRAGMNFHDRAGVESMLTGLEVLQLVEDDHRGMSFEGPRHWHVFHIVARA
ncbi:class I SAM-dependent methyltransferase [Leifsonia sp. NPDC058292]|uniref:class I SAM-dependent methyltransferase n=1 Tax=Leifsonia sp. NPDC058292 TaxID=3346428 RepID=UPI0036D9614E